MITQELINDIKMGTNIIDGSEYKDTLQAVAQITCDIVVKTLGPYASTTVIDDGTSTYSTKDGWSVVNRIRFSDSIENILFGFIKDISFSLNSKVGDGTTTAIVAANTFIEKFRNWIENARSNKESEFHNLRQADLLKAIEETAESIIEELKSEKRVKKIESPEDIYKIAYVSTNGNEEVSKMIQSIYKETSNPNIHVTLNTGGTTRYEIENGYKLDAKLLNETCHYNTSEETCELNDECKIVIFDHNVTYTRHYKLIQSLIKSICNNQAKPQTLVILAPFYDEIFSSIMGATIRKIVNNGQICPVILVQIPYSTTTQKCYINDFSILCETQIFDSSKLEMYTQMNKAISGEVEEDEKAQEVFKALMESSEFKTPEDIIDCSVGKCRKLTIGKNFLLLEKFRKDTTMYKNMYDFINKAYEAAKAKADETQNRINLSYSEAHMRLIKFAGQTGTIFVGGDSELSCKCLKDAVDDAVLACRSAYEYGYIRGLNLETLSAITKLSNETEVEDDHDIKHKLTKECLRMFFDVFENLAISVMYNKYVDDGISREEFINAPIWNNYWLKNDNKLYMDGKDINTPTKIIYACIENGYEYNIVTEQFAPAGYSVINSVATDIEIIKATTSILTLLLSSNQLVTINRQYNREKTREEAEKRERERYANITDGILSTLSRYSKMLDCSISLPSHSSDNISSTVALL